MSHATQTDPMEAFHDWCLADKRYAELMDDSVPPYADHHHGQLIWEAIEEYWQDAQGERQTLTLALEGI